MSFIQSLKRVCVAPVLCLKVFTQMTTVSRSLYVPQLPVKSKLKPSQHISFGETVQEWWYLSNTPQSILHDVSLKSAPFRTQVPPTKKVLSLCKRLWLNHATETATQASLQAMHSTKQIPTDPNFLFPNGILHKPKHQQSTLVLTEHPILEVEK
jgi:predicted secreted hydrolase